MPVQNEFTDIIDGSDAVGAGKVERVTSANLSSFDDIEESPYVTVSEGMRRMLRIRSWKVERIESSNPRVATAKIIRNNDSNTVEITGHKPGTAILSAAWSSPTLKLNVIEGRLEVDVCRQRTVFLNFHFVDKDSLGNRTSLNVATAQKEILPFLNDVFRAANIEFRIHAHRRVPEELTSSLAFAPPNQMKANRAQLYTTLFRLGRDFDASQSHIQIWFVKIYGVEDTSGLVLSGPIGHPIFPIPVTVNIKVPDKDTAGGTMQGGNGYPPFIVIEDEPQTSMGFRLAHEVGHALGLYVGGTHSQRKDALMYPNTTYKGTKQ